MFHTNMDFMINPMRLHEATASLDMEYIILMEGNKGEEGRVLWQKMIESLRTNA